MKRIILRIAIYIKEDLQPRKFSLITMYMLMLTCLSCENYYQISKSPQNTAKPDTVIPNNSQRYFILRNGDSAYHMSNIVISDDKQSLTCTLDRLTSDHKLHLTRGRNGNMRYLKKTADINVLNEAHVYIQYDSTAIAGNNYMLTFDKIRKIDVLEKDEGRTSKSYVLGGIGIALGVVATFVVTVGVIYALNPWTF